MAARQVKTVWPSGLRRWLKAPVRKGVGSNPTAVIYAEYEEDSRHRPYRNVRRRWTLGITYMGWVHAWQYSCS